jgi:nucleotidyltransferase/DNA polymerase involved in DNA repair
MGASSHGVVYDRTNDPRGASHGDYLQLKHSKLHLQLREASAVSNAASVAGFHPTIGRQTAAPNSDLFAGCVFWASGRVHPTLHELRAIIGRCGGQFFFQFDPSVTHIVVENMAPTSMLAAYSKKVVVEPAWVVDSAASGQLRPIAPYAPAFIVAFRNQLARTRQTLLDDADARGGLRGSFRPSSRPAAATTTAAGSKFDDPPAPLPPTPAQASIAELVAGHPADSPAAIFTQVAGAALAQADGTQEPPDASAPVPAMSQTPEPDIPIAPFSRSYAQMAAPLVAMCLPFEAARAWPTRVILPARPGAHSRSLKYFAHVPAGRLAVEARLAEASAMLNAKPVETRGLSGAATPVVPQLRSKPGRKQATDVTDARAHSPLPSTEASDDAPAADLHTHSEVDSVADIPDIVGPQAAPDGRANVAPDTQPEAPTVLSRWLRQAASSHAHDLALLSSDWVLSGVPGRQLVTAPPRDAAVDSADETPEGDRGIDTSAFSADEIAQRLKPGTPGFFAQFFSQSRLHHLSAWRSGLASWLASSEFLAEVHALGGLGPAPESPKSASTGTDLPLGRVIFHCDLDCFFATASLLAHPNVSRKAPVAICHSRSGSFASSSDVSACNYAARARGVRNGIWLGEARKLCPELVVLPYEFELYARVSRRVYLQFARVTAAVNPVSCDEAHLDVTGLASSREAYLQLADRLRASVLNATDCEMSVGIGPSLLLARLALRIAKPDGAAALWEPEDARPVTDAAPLTIIPGIGPAVAAKLAGLLPPGGEPTCGLARRVLDERTLVETVGPTIGAQIFHALRGLDTRQLATAAWVRGDDEDAGPKTLTRRSVAVVVNWGVRLASQDHALAFVRGLAMELSGRMRRVGVAARHFTLKVNVRAPDAPVMPAKNGGAGFCVPITGIAAPTEPVSGAALVPLVRRLYLALSPSPRPAEIRGMELHAMKLIRVGGRRAVQVRLPGFMADPAASGITGGDSFDVDAALAISLRRTADQVNARSRLAHAKRHLRRAWAPEPSAATAAAFSSWAPQNPLYAAVAAGTLVDQAGLDSDMRAALAVLSAAVDVSSEAYGRAAAAVAARWDGSVLQFS